MNFNCIRALLVAVLCGVAAVAFSTGGPTKDRPTLTALHLRFFENDMGTLSEEISAGSEGAQRNPAAGPNAGTAVLAVVEIGGPPGAAFTALFGPDHTYKVRLVATEGNGRKLLLDETEPIPVLSAAGRTFIAFLLHPGGCATVRLQASLIGRNPGPILERLLLLSCGE